MVGTTNRITLHNHLNRIPRSIRAILEFTLAKTHLFHNMLDSLFYRHLTFRRLNSAKRIVASSGWSDSALTDTTKISEAELAIKNLKLRHLYDHPAKVWDGYHFFSYIITHLSTSAKILDMGSGPHANVLDWLQLYGYHELWATDLVIQKRIRLGSIEYVGEDLLHTHYPDLSFDCIICQSVIEHNIDFDLFFREVRRILKSGGFLLVSTDYWPEKIDTIGLTMYGRPWSIFSKEEITVFAQRAQLYGLSLKEPLNLQAKHRIIDVFGKEYTFISLTFQKLSDQILTQEPPRVFEA